MRSSSLKSWVVSKIQQSLQTQLSKERAHSLISNRQCTLHIWLLIVRLPSCLPFPPSNLRKGAGENSRAMVSPLKLSPSTVRIYILMWIINSRWYLLGYSQWCHSLLGNRSQFTNSNLNWTISLFMWHSRICSQSLLKINLRSQHSENLIELRTMSMLPTLSRRP